MIQILELIKHFVLGIVSLIICSISMAEINKTKDFIKIINKVKKEFPEGSLERKIPTGFIATTSATETGNFNFKGAPTAMKANNYFGMHATGDQEFLETTGGAKLRSFPDDKSSIRSFISLITTDDRYKSVIDSTDKVEEMFKGMSPYAERKDYVNFLSSVYTDRIKPIIETQNMLIPRAKPLNQQMDNLQ